MKLVKNIKEIKTQEPPYFCLTPLSSNQEIYLWEVGYKYICSINNEVHILKDMNTNEDIKVTDNVYQHLLSIGEDINDSY